MAKFYSKEEIQLYRSFFEEYLQLKGINTKKLFRCVSPEHEDKNPSMSFFKKSNTCYCFGCRKMYDIFKFVGLEYGLNTFIQQIKKVSELYKNKERIVKDSINDTIYAKKNVTVKLETLDEIKNTKEIKKSGFSSEKGYREYVYKCYKNNKNTNYLTEIRKIPQEIVDKYYIGYDDNFKVKDFKTNKIKYWKAIIIPTDMGSLVVRNTDLSSDRLRKVGNGAIFNYWELKENPERSFYIVEGEIDALSIIALNKKSIALGSVTQINLLVEKLKKDKIKNHFYVMLDNDKTGNEAQITLVSELQKLGINYTEVNVLKDKGYKDANDYLKANSLEFKRELDKFEQRVSWEYRSKGLER